MEFSVRGMKKAISSETDKQISNDAAIELGNLLEHYGQEIAEYAVEHAERDGRVTVREEDVRQALFNRRKLVVEEEKGGL